MKVAVALAVVLALAGCKKKPDDAQPPVGSDKPVVTEPIAKPVVADQVAAVGAQQTRLEELAGILDKADVVSGPIALLEAITKLPEWNMLVSKVDKLKTVNDVAVTLKDAVAQLQALKTKLLEASQRLANVKAMLAHVAVGSKVDELKKLVSGEVRGALEPLALQIATTIQKVLVPLSTQLTDTADTIIGACAIAKLSSGGKDVTALCAKVKDTFGLATTFLADLKAKPSTLYAEVSAKLEAQLGDLIDAATKTTLEVAQAQIDAALKLPPANGSGSAAGSGSGSAP